MRKLLGSFSLSTPVSNERWERGTAIPSSLIVAFLFAVCDEHCGETSIDPENQLLVCRISGHCFTAWVSGAEKVRWAVIVQKTLIGLVYGSESFFSCL